MQRPPADRAPSLVAAVKELRAGRAIMLVHNLTETAHLIASGQHVAMETLELMSARGRGVLRAAMTAERMKLLGLGGLASSPADGRLYAAPVDLAGHDRAGSLADRVATAHALAASEPRPELLVTPGHVFPVEADPDGCLAIAQLPDAALDLARLAGCEVGVYADLAEPARVSSDPAERERVGRELGVAVIQIRELVVDRERNSMAVRRIVSADLPTLDGELTAIGYRSKRTGDDYIAFVHGELREYELPVYLHSRCPVSDVFGGLDCGCGERLQAALTEICERGDGMVLYSDRGAGKHLGHLHPLAEPPYQPGRVLKASREREIASVLRDLGVASIRLTSNAPVDCEFLEALGIEIVDETADARTAA